jgi:hypothetical protein
VIGAYRVKSTRCDSTEQAAMTARRFQCMEGPQCDRYARVTIEDITYQRGRACPHHAVDALNRPAGARIIWDDTRGLNEHEATALHLAEERSQLAQKMHPGNRCLCQE